MTNIPTGSPVIQRTDEEISYTFDWSADGTPTSPSVTVVDRATGTSITLTGDPTIDGDTIITQEVSGLTEGHTYTMTCTVTIEGVELSSECVIICTDGPATGYQTDITLDSMILEVARAMGIAYDGTATGGTTTTLIDTVNLLERDDFYNKGFIMFLSGANKGVVKTISDFVNSTATISWSGAIAAVASGVEYVATSPEFPYTKIKAALNEVLKRSPFLQSNETLTTTADTVAYDLPANVYNIKRVEVAQDTSSPYYYVTYFNWKERNGQIIFDNIYFPVSGYKIRLWYECPHGELPSAGVLRPTIDPDWLKWAAIAWLYRDLITRIKKDDPTSVDLLNEAKMREDEAKKHMKRNALASMDQDPRLAHW